MRTTISLVGPLGSGKTTLAHELAAAGWHVISAADVLREVAQVKGQLFQTREEMQNFGWVFLSEEGGAQFFADRLASKASGKSKIVFEGIRPVEVLRLLKKIFPDILVIYVAAPFNVRKQRVIARDNISEERFVEYDSHLVELQVNELVDESEFMLNNISKTEAAKNHLMELIN